MSAFEIAFSLLKGLGREIGADGTPCPQCGQKYDVDGDDWNEVVGYMGETKTGLGQYICFDCDLEFKGPKGTGEFIERNPDNWQVGQTDGMDFTISPVMSSEDTNIMDALGSFMSDRSVPALDEAKRAFLDDYLQNFSYDSPQNARLKEQITNAIMAMNLDEFTAEMERKASTPHQHDGQFPTVFAMRRAGEAALDILNRMGGMDEGMA
jgi:hypothetical protein